MNKFNHFGGIFGDNANKIIFILGIIDLLFFGPEIIQGIFEIGQQVGNSLALWLR